MVKIHKIILIFLCFLFSGCISYNKDTIEATKTTVFGLDLSTGKYVKIRFGLIRHFQQTIPVYTNQIFYPLYSSSVDSDIGWNSQNVKELFIIGNTNIIK